MNAAFLDIIEVIGAQAAYKLYDKYKQSKFYICQTRQAELAEIVGIDKAKLLVREMDGRRVYFSSKKDRRIMLIDACVELKNNGMNASQIARMLCISESSVHNHLKKVENV